MTDLNLNRVPPDDLDELADAVTAFIDVLQRIEKRDPGTFPAGMVNALISMEVSCCIELTQRGIVPDLDEESSEFMPVTIAPEDSAFTGFIEAIDFDQSLDDGDES